MKSNSKSGWVKVLEALKAAASEVRRGHVRTIGILGLANHNKQILVSKIVP